MNFPETTKNRVAFKININEQKCPILGRVGTYHVTVDITGKDIKIGDEVIFNANIKHVDSSVKREWN